MVTIVSFVCVRLCKRHVRVIMIFSWFVSIRSIAFALAPGQTIQKFDETLNSHAVGIDTVCAVAEKLYAKQKRDYSRLLKIIAKIQANTGLACSSSLFGNFKEG